MTDIAEKTIAEAIDYLVAHHTAQPELDQLARRAGYEPTYFRKLFKEKVGISPKRLLQYMNMRHAGDLLARGETTLDAAQATGLSGTGRLYDLFVTCQAVTPGDVQFRGRGLTVTYGFHPSPLGEILVAQTGRGVCYLGFLVDGDRAAPVAKMQKALALATYQHDDAAILPAARQVLNIWRGAKTEPEQLRLDLHGTNLQIQVWQALLKIPHGMTATYQDIARSLGRPTAARAVGNAVGANPVSLLVPCHRVIRATGIIDNYGWGSPRKKLILALEMENRLEDS